MLTQPEEVVDVTTNWPHYRHRIGIFSYRLKAAYQQLDEWPPQPSRHTWWHNPFAEVRYFIRKARQHCNATAHYLGTDGERRILVAICITAFFPDEDNVDLQRLDDRLADLESLLCKFCQTEPTPQCSDIDSLTVDLQALDAVASNWK